MSGAACGSQFPASKRSHQITTIDVCQQAPRDASGGRREISIEDDGLRRQSLCVQCSTLYLVQGARLAIILTASPASSIIITILSSQSQFNNVARCALERWQTMSAESYAGIGSEQWMFSFLVLWWRPWIPTRRRRAGRSAVVIGSASFYLVPLSRSLLIRTREIGDSLHAIYTWRSQFVASAQ